MATARSRTKAAAEAPAKTETLQQLKNRLRNEAEREVLNSHKDEVIKITEAKYKEHDLEYVRRLSDEEKAAKEIEQHLQKYPALRNQFAPAPSADGTDEFGTAPINGELQQ